MFIKVLHQEKGSRKLLAEFPNKAFSVLVLKDKENITTQETQFTMPK